MKKYGRAEVESWYWEVWNEPDIGYWQGTPEEYLKLYDYAADGLKRALPTARIGGPEVTGSLTASARRSSCATSSSIACAAPTTRPGKIGTPLDFVSFHAKGAPRVVKENDAASCGCGSATSFAPSANGFSIVASFPELKDMPIVIGESDPEGCAACP